MKRLLVVALALVTSGAMAAAAQQTAAPTWQMTKPQTSTQHTPAPAKPTETKHEGVGKHEQKREEAKHEQKHKEAKKHERAKKRAQAKKHEAKGSAQTEQQPR
ncbi:MAG: hypothetical protein NZ960_03220 [Candidatus Kapabacteria bacterium]|nr:hypothetical protein [Candidatus Kapabacteria bacterium]